MGDVEAMAFGKINPPVFKMYAEEFEKIGLKGDQMRDLIFLHAELAAKIAQAELDYFEGVKKVLRP
jgi:hypothetical protein